MTPLRREHDYQDLDGHVVYRVVIERADANAKKRVWCEHRDAHGRWVKGIGDDAPVVPYRWPELAASPVTVTVYITEGEKDANRLISLGLIATTNALGAMKWKPEHSEFLRGRHIAILPDNDEPGRRHADQVARSVQPLAASVKVVELGLTGSGEDVSDWLDAGGTKEGLVALIDTTAVWRAGGEASEPEYEDEVDRPPSDDVEAAVAWLNKTHAVVRENGKTVIIIERFDPMFQRMYIDRCTAADLRLYFQNQTYDVGRRYRVGLGAVWCEHALRRTLQGIVFAPEGPTPRGYFNLWRGWSVAPMAGDWSLLQAHMLDNLCGGNCAHFDYLIAWMASAVQHPGRQGHVAVVLRGNEGVGKGVFAKEFGKVFGQHWVHLSQSAHLVGHFNAHLRDSVLVFADEALWAGDKAAEGVLKALITEEIVSIERKGVDVIQVPNVIHLIIASNNDWVVPAGLEARRYFVLNVDDGRRGDYPYFAAITAQMERGGRAAMLFDLLAYDLTSVNVRAAPATVGLHDQKLLSMSPELSWWLDKLMAGSQIRGSGWETDVRKAWLYDDYVSSTQKVGISRRSGETQLGIFLRKMMPGTSQAHPIRSAVKRDGAVERQPFWEFASLEACRQQFDMVTGSVHEWPAVGDEVQTCPTSGSPGKEVKDESNRQTSAPF